MQRAPDRLPKLRANFSVGIKHRIQREGAGSSPWVRGFSRGGFDDLRREQDGGLGYVPSLRRSRQLSVKGVKVGDGLDRGGYLSRIF